MSERETWKNTVLAGLANYIDAGSIVAGAAGLGIWSFFVPAITAAGFHTLAWILTGFVAASALLGLFFAPSNAGKSLDEIQEEQSASRRFTRAEPTPTR